IQRREALLRTSLKVKRANFANVASTFAMVSADTIHTVSQRMAAGDCTTFNSSEELQVLNLMRQINAINSHVPGSTSGKVEMRNEIRALTIEKGAPSFYITINPADVYNPIV
ncbi:hypothetical protein F5878DRAFT_508267, partial [Lentinula raphanica]